MLDDDDDSGVADASKGEVRYSEVTNVECRFRLPCNLNPHVVYYYS
jgi:hypothetical protein